jgi:membrane-associated phospholipid phosphatase
MITKFQPLKSATFADSVFVYQIFAGFALALILYGINRWGLQYESVPLFIDVSFGNLLFDGVVLILCVIMFTYGIYIQQENPRGATFIWGLSSIILTALNNVAFVNGVALTPFHPIDQVLLNADLAFGLNTLTLLQWMHQEPFLRKVMWFSYQTLVIELFCIPFVLAALNARQALRVFLNAVLFSSFIGGMIYYFFPTIAPAGILHSPYFIQDQKNVGMHFYQLHHYLKITALNGGLIAFPSFHVVWAVLLTYATYQYKIIFYPLMVFNALLIVSTVVLGWHYGVDVIAGAIVAVMSIWFAKWCEAI